MPAKQHLRIVPFSAAWSILSDASNVAIFRSFFLGFSSWQKIHFSQITRVCKLLEMGRLCVFPSLLDEASADSHGTVWQVNVFRNAFADLRCA